MNMEENFWKTLLVVVALIGVWAFGFYMGRETVKDPKSQIITEYVKGDTVRDSILCPVPYKVTEPVDTMNIIKQCIKDGVYSELWPQKTVTEYIEITKSDTTAMLKDWATKRYYKETLFDSDTLGTCCFDAEVQYNRMRVLNYTYIPITKTTTQINHTIKAFSPFVGAGAMFNTDTKDPMLNASVGFFIKEKYGLELNYQHDFMSKNDLVGGTILYKF